MGRSSRFLHSPKAIGHAVSRAVRDQVGTMATSRESSPKERSSSSPSSRSSSSGSEPRRIIIPPEGGCRQDHEPYIPHGFQLAEGMGDWDAEVVKATLLPKDVYVTVARAHSSFTCSHDPLHDAEMASVLSFVQDRLGLLHSIYVAHVVNPAFFGHERGEYCDLYDRLFQDISQNQKSWFRTVFSIDEDDNNNTDTSKRAQRTVTCDPIWFQRALLLLTTYGSMLCNDMKKKKNGETYEVDATMMKKCTHVMDVAFTILGRFQQLFQTPRYYGNDNLFKCIRHCTYELNFLSLHVHLLNNDKKWAVAAFRGTCKYELDKSTDILDERVAHLIPCRKARSSSPSCRSVRSKALDKARDDDLWEILQFSNLHLNVNVPPEKAQQQGNGEKCLRTNALDVVSFAQSKDWTPRKVKCTPPHKPPSPTNVQDEMMKSMFLSQQMKLRQYQARVARQHAQISTSQKERKTKPEPTAKKSPKKSQHNG